MNLIIHTDHQIHYHQDEISEVVQGRESASSFVTGRQGPHTSACGEEMIPVSMNQAHGKHGQGAHVHTISDTNSNPQRVPKGRKTIYLDKCKNVQSNFGG